MSLSILSHVRSNMERAPMTFMYGFGRLGSGNSFATGSGSPAKTIARKVSLNGSCMAFVVMILAKQDEQRPCQAFLTRMVKILFASLSRFWYIVGHK